VGTHPIHPGYAGIPTFFQAPYAEMDAVREGMTVVAGVPIDQGIITAKPGTRFGPRAIREASLMPRGVLAANVEHTWVDVDTGVALRLKDRLDLVDVGDFDIDPTDIMKTTTSVVTGVEQIVKRGGRPVVLGGDHYIAYPCFEGFVRGMSERKENLRVGTCTSTRTRTSGSSTDLSASSTTRPPRAGSARTARRPTGTWPGSA
jgi:arginase family enzyme